MNRSVWVFAMAAIVSIHVSTTAIAADDPLMGNWAGQWNNEQGDEGKLEAQIIALGKMKYQANFTVHTEEKVMHVSIPLEAEGTGTPVPFAGKAEVGDDKKTVELRGEVASERLTGSYMTVDGDSGRIELEKVYKKSPTLGAKPPEGAVVLFDGRSLAGWHRRGSDQSAGWKVEDGVAEVVRGTGDIVSNEAFGDHKLHVEFRTPFMPEARGQGRGNSGVYVQGRYEVQVLDSFGLEGLDNECGGIYHQHRPLVNACLPPGEWQTYDITFHAARVNDDGKVVEPARLTVMHNGILIHDNVAAKGPSAGGTDEKEGGSAPLLLQDHGNPVQYRNIWAVRLKQ